MRTATTTHLAVAMSVGTLALLGSQPAAAGEPRVMASVVSVDLPARTATFPLHKGIAPDGSPTWYVVTEASDRATARRLGVNAAPKLANALGTRAVQRVRRTRGLLRFSGTVDFAPRHTLTPGRTVFPPAVAAPGSVGDRAYSPLVTAGGGVVLDAEQVANSSGLHDKVVAIDRAARRVTLQLTQGWARDGRVLYLSTDSSDRVAATLEASTYAPRLGASPGVASDDPASSARTGLVAVVNGVANRRSPDRQGLISAIRGQGDPLNVLQWGPTAGQYSPLWDVHPALWTEAAVRTGDRGLLTGFSEVANAVGRGQIVSAADGRANDRIEGLRAAGLVVNCPIVVAF
jgi:hypothetical protein